MPLIWLLCWSGVRAGASDMLLLRHHDVLHLQRKRKTRIFVRRPRVEAVKWQPKKNACTRQALSY
jgi:hypothetical protein